MASWNKISRTENHIEIPGSFTHAFIHNGGTFFLTEIKIYKDGMIDCWGLVNFEEFKQKVAQGWVVTTLPNNAEVSVSLLANFKATEVQAWVKEDEFIKEVADQIERLNERPTSADKCLKAYQHFQSEQSEEARQLLKESYEAVPEHHRRSVLGDMDVKDIPIRMIIYGEDEIEKWSHRLVARQQGMNPLPSINVKGALKKKGS
jgi:hypothetical protein